MGRLSAPLPTLPFRSSATVSVPAAGSATAAVTEPASKRVLAKDIVITTSANGTVDAIRINGVDVGEVASFDVEDVFGNPVDVGSGVEVDFSNSGAGAEDNTVEVVGVEIED